jgi:tetratricopeptide (TPR) repeat protein
MLNPGVRAFPRLSEAERELAEGRYDAAARHVLQHLREHRNEPRGLALLGSIALKTGALVQAEQFLRHAMAVGLTTLEVQRELASAINQQERLGEALAAFTYLEAHLRDAQITATKALILDKLGRNAEALPVHAGLVERNPGEPPFWIGYGHSLRAAGRIDDAVTAYRQALKVDPERGEAWWALASIKSRVLTDEDISTMEGMVGGAVDLVNVVPLHFALGRARHDRKEYETAFRHFAEGNRLRSETINYRAEELTEEVDAFIRLFGPDFFETPGEPAAERPIPVFLISMPRSGSTLLEQMLDQHPAIEAIGELPYIRALLRSAMEIHTRRGPAMVPEIVLNLSTAEKRAFGRDYLDRASLHRRSDAPYFIDKMPMNWSDVLFIRQILPQAKFVEIRRDAMDCCFSNFIHYFSRAHAASFSLHDVGACFVDYVRLMEHLGSVAPGLIRPVRYEQLVEQPERELRAILDYLGLPWDEAVLRFYESERPVRTPSAEQVRRPINRQGIGSWRPYAEWLGPLRDALGPLADG